LSDPLFGGALLRTAFFIVVTVPATVLLGLALANVLNKPVPGRAALRAIFFLPYVVNMIAVGTVWLILLNPQGGAINTVLGWIGISEGPGWLTSSTWALPALMIIAVWSGVGYVSVIYLAAMQDLPSHLYEAAAIDGAGAWQRFKAITWPALMPTTVFLVITSMISTSQGFGMIAFLTQGGPGTSTTTASYYMYQSGFLYYRFGYAAAVGMTMFVLVLGLTILSWRLQRGRGMAS
jgi:ABC-type sugar transport system permease subunit